MGRGSGTVNICGGVTKHFRRCFKSNVNNTVRMKHYLIFVMLSYLLLRSDGARKSSLLYEKNDLVLEMALLQKVYLLVVLEDFNGGFETAITQVMVEIAIITVGSKTAGDNSLSVADIVKNLHYK